MPLISPPASLNLTNGPIDDAHEFDSGRPCPQCQNLTSCTPPQDSYCHSGRYQTSVLVHIFWCENCEEVYVEENEAKEALNSPRNRKLAKLVDPGA